MTATHDVHHDLSRLADDGCPHDPSADRSAGHPSLAAMLTRPAAARSSAVARFLRRLWP